MAAAHEQHVESTVTIKQHPLHPMVVVFPIAFLIAPVVTDSVYWWKGDAFWAEASFWLATAGFSMGVLAAALGLVDFVRLKEVRQLIAGWNHMLAAVLTLALAGANVQLRMSDPVAAVLPWGIGLSAVMMLVVSVTGWLGGTLSFRYGIGSYTHELDLKNAGPDGDAPDARAESDA